MRYSDVERALLANGCKWRQGKGDHSVWYCPCGQHIAVVTQARTVSPGVVADTIKKLACLPEGWLQ
jgi:predicted RNA binding protein YcfA (HicA-like mRNA interferase family)